MTIHLKSRPGFALVVTLTLMVLLTVLAVALLSLSSIELLRTSVTSDTQRARTNARMGLMLAIGQLQKQLGPDRRVNAPASQLSNSSGVTTSAASGNQQWTGVYDSWDSVTNENRPSPKFRSWLISGDDTQTTNPDTPKTSLVENVAKIWKGTLADGSDRVSVPKIAIRSGSSANPDGACAWWTSDENSKALIRHIPAQVTLASAYRNTQAAPGNALGLNSDLSTIDPESPKLLLLASAGCLDLAAANRGLSGKLLHDFTTSSLGLPTDVARGGLKRDLSLFLDHPVSKPVVSSLPNTGVLYPNGITWEELWLYHNVWRALEPPASGLASSTGGNLSNTRILQTPAGIGEASITAFRADPFSIYKLPNLIRTQWLLSMWAKEKPNPSPTAAKTYELHWVTDGILTLWNPYDVPIALHPDAYMSVKYWNIPYELKVFSGQTQIAGTNFSTASGAGHSYTMIVGTASAPYWGRAGTPDPVALMPGEVLIMSENPGVGAPVPYDSNDAKRSLAMKAGWNLGRGRSKVMSLTSGTTISANTSLRYEATPNNDNAWQNSTQFNIVNQDYFYGADYRGNKPPNTLAESAGGRVVRTADRSFATAHQDVFPPFGGDLPSPNTMTGAGKHAFLVFSHQVKTEDSGTSWTRFHNPHAMQAMLTKLDGPELAMSGHEIVIKGLSGNMDSNMPQLSSNINRGLFGGSYTDLARGQDTVIVQSIPREPPLSLGAFQHAIANGFTSRMSGGALRTDSTTFSKPEISHAISNSYALPVLAPASASNLDYKDHSYHANRMLWDSWFLSGIVQQQSPHHSIKRTASEVFQKFVVSENPEPLPNRAFKRWTDDPSTVTARLFSGSDAKADAHELASSMLMIEGAFNVNSTSVEAWKSVLASLDGAMMPVGGDSNQPGAVEARKANGVAVNNLLTAFGTGTPDSAAFDESILSTPDNKAQWRGYRKLSHDEIKALAEALVVEIRKRGPFLSLSDFVNRRLTSDKQSALCGPLQAALDKTVNAKLLSSAQRVASSQPAAGFSFPEAATIAKTLIGPAHVKQADILTPIGPRLTARSDTFRIRAYGEARDQSGKITSQAWCEAVIQRTPEYLDPADPSQAAENITGRSIPALTSNVNKSFGRRLVATSFRWISPSELGY